MCETRRQVLQEKVIISFRRNRVSQECKNYFPQAMFTSTFLRIEYCRRVPLCSEDAWYGFKISVAAPEIFSGAVAHSRSSISHPIILPFMGIVRLT